MQRFDHLYADGVRWERCQDLSLGAPTEPEGSWRRLEATNFAPDAERKPHGTLSYRFPTMLAASYIPSPSKLKSSSASCELKNSSNSPNTSSGVLATMLSPSGKALLQPSRRTEALS